MALSDRSQYIANLNKVVNKIKTQTTMDNFTVNVDGTGIPKGTEINGDNVVDIVKQMLRKLVKATATIAYSVTNATVEKGTTISPVITVKNIVKGDYDVSKIEFYNGSTLLDTKNYSAETTEYTYTLSDLSTDTTLSAKVYDSENNVTDLQSKKYTFVNPFYYGSLDDVPNGNTVKTLTKLVETKGNKTKSFTSNFQTIVFAYPKEYGNLTNIINQNNYEVISNFTKIEVQVNNVAYNCYYAENVNVSDFKYTFKF